MRFEHLRQVPSALRRHESVCYCVCCVAASGVCLLWLLGLRGGSSACVVGVAAMYAGSVSAGWHECIHILCMLVSGGGSRPGLPG